MNNIPVNIQADASVDTDHQVQQAEPFVADFGQGPIRMIAATSVDHGEMLKDNGDKIGAIFLSSARLGMGLSIMLSPDDLREFAGRMIETAAMLEAQAADAAAAAIEKARGQ